jgi:hemerythrin-like domain-containing protein
VSRLQDDLTTQKTITDVMARENKDMRKQLEKLMPVVDFVNRLDNPEELRKIIDFLAESYSHDGKLRPLNEMQFAPFIQKTLDGIMKEKGITMSEAIRQLATEDLEEMKRAERQLRQAARKARSRNRKEPNGQSDGQPKDNAPRDS